MTYYTCEMMRADQQQFERLRTEYRQHGEDGIAMVLLWMWMMATVLTPILLGVVVFTGNWSALIALVCLWPVFFYGCREAT